MGSNNFLNVSYFYEKIYQIFNGTYLPSSDSTFAVLDVFLRFIKPFSVVASLFFLTGIIYSAIRTNAIMREVFAATHGGHDDSHGAPAGAHGAEHAHSAEPSGHVSKDSRWEKITEHIASQNPSDWRLAILECDIILDEMLTKMSYHGETLSDKLKAVEKSDFLSIDKAWEAHRVRNAIAHEGSNFQISDREARRVVSLYEEVLREFHYI